MVWVDLVKPQKRKRIGGGTYRTPGGRITSDAPDLLVLRRPNLGSVGIYPILNVVIGGQWDELVQCCVDIARRPICCQSLVRNVSRRSHLSHRPPEQDQDIVPGEEGDLSVFSL